jgi:hypothetical protein
VVALFLAAASGTLARRAGNVAALPAVLAALFVIASLLLDARWTWNLARQADATAGKYSGKDWHARHLAAEDGPLFAFIEKVRAKLPATPARVIVAADADYFRGRGAFHLYPHNVSSTRRNVMPAELAAARRLLRRHQRRGVQFDPAQQKLRWTAVGRSPPSLLAEGGARRSRSADMDTSSQFAMLVPRIGIAALCAMRDPRRSLRKP